MTDNNIEKIKEIVRAIWADGYASRSNTVREFKNGQTPLERQDEYAQQIADLDKSQAKPMFNKEDIEKLREKIELIIDTARGLSNNYKTDAFADQILSEFENWANSKEILKIFNLGKEVTRMSETDLQNWVKEQGEGIKEKK